MITSNLHKCVFCGKLFECFKNSIDCLKDDFHVCLKCDTALEKEACEKARHEKIIDWGRARKKSCKQ